jgi:primary-amine oxidase
MDGTIEVEVRLTGVMNLRRTQLARDTTTVHDGHGDYGHLVAPRVFAPNHQHFFAYRLDFDVDGATPNAAVEVNSEADPVDAENPAGLWFRMTERVLPSELEGRRSLNLATARKWKVVNTGTTNALGQATGYALLPGENSLVFAAPSSPVVAKASWLASHVWFTPYAPDEQHAGGDYQRLDRPADGLATWTRRDRPLRDQDVVRWYVFGITHIPRPEDYPVMPAHRVGFRLVPSGFFSRNPVLDAPAPPIR